MRLRSIGFIAAALLAAFATGAAAQTTEPAVPHDNTRGAGIVEQGTLTVRLRAGTASWRPEGAGGPALTIEAFGEEGGALTVPAPLIRVTEGTRLVVSVRNELPTPLRVHGLCARDGGACAPLEVPPGNVRETRFVSGEAGTYHYWASAIGAPVPFRELAGAIVVDPPGGQQAEDRIFVITEWNSLTARQLVEVMSADDSSAAFLATKPRVTFVINGLSWPDTERLTYRRGDTVRWRVVNVSSQAHPMHLHGFYFTVTHMGDGRVDRAVGGHGRRVVTQMLPSGGTLAMEWTPEREGNWLFHCHIMSHVSPDRRFDGGVALGDSHPAHTARVGTSKDVPLHSAHAAHASHAGHGSAQHDRSLGMAGMVLGISVLPPTNTPPPAPKAAVEPRRITMVIQAGRYEAGSTPTAGFVITEAGAVAADAAASPGPTLVLRRDEPVEITVVNRLAEATSIHWHGLELDSYYDGVHGWSGVNQRLAPMIDPGASFVVRITPPRSGTFIYHTHLHDYRQLTSGLYGPLIVTEPGETYDPATDHVVVLGRKHATDASSIYEDAETAVINGERSAQMVWRAGVRNRIRIINITPDDTLNVALVSRDTPVTWQPLTKDGAAVPEAEAQPEPAKLRIGVGETYDFTFDAPPGRATLWLDVRMSGGRWQSQARVFVK